MYLYVSLQKNHLLHYEMILKNPPIPKKLKTNQDKTMKLKKTQMSPKKEEEQLKLSNNQGKTSKKEKSKEI